MITNLNVCERVQGLGEMTSLTELDLTSNDIESVPIGIGHAPGVYTYTRRAYILVHAYACARKSVC